MKTLQEQYNLIKEGKGHKDVFVKEAKRLFPNIVPNSATFNQTAKLLKQRSVINENIFPLMPSSGLNPFTTFDKFINEEAKADEKKTTKEVNQAETAGYDYKDPKNLNNQIFDQYLNGVRVELEKDPGLTLERAREIVAKNLEKDPIFYTKNAAFKVDGLGYQELENSKEPTGKHKSSGYGDLKENKMDSLNNFRKFLLTENENKGKSDGHPYTDILYTGVGVDGVKYVISAFKDGSFYWLNGPGKVAISSPGAFDFDYARGEIKWDQKELDDKLKSGDTVSIYDDPNYTYKFNKDDYMIQSPKMNESLTSDDYKELLEEAVAGVPSLGNPFLERPKTAYENKFESFLNEEEANEIRSAYNEEKEEVKKEEKKMKKEGRMKMAEVLKEAERLGELAKKKVEAKVYERAIAERKKAVMVNEDEALSEFINQEAIREVEKEIKELEKKLMEVAADKNTMTGGK